MIKRTRGVLVAALLLGAFSALAKLPPAPPMDPAAKAAADEKKKAAAEKEKAELAAAEDRAVKNYQENMRKEGKPILKPVPVAAPKPQSNTAKANQKKQ